MATESETKEPSSESLQDTVHIPFDGDAIAMNGSSISHEIAKDETLHPIAVRMLNSSKGEVLVESPIDIQHLTSNRNNTAVMNEKLSTAQAESMEDELQGETDIKKLEKANEDKQIKVQAEAGILNDKSTDEIDSISDAGPSELEIVKDPPEIMISDLEPAANEPQSDKIESPANEAPEEPETNRLERRNEDKAVEPSEKGNTQEPLDEMSKGNLEPAKYEQALDAVPEEMEARKLERVTEDNNVKIDETGICNNEIAKNADGISVLEASDNENRQESLEITPNKDLEPAEDEVGNGKLESSLDAVPEDPKEKNLERVNEDEIGKREAETGFCDDERSDDADRIPVGKPSQKESRQEPLELDVSEQNKLESSLDVVPEEPEEKKLESVNEHKNVIIEAKTGNADIERIDDAESVSEAGPSENENKQEPLQIIAKEDFGATEDAPAHETETTRKEESFVNLEEFSPKDEKKYEPIEKASVMMPEPQNAEISNLIKETEGASENTSTNEVIKETIHEESYKNEGTNNSACEELDQNDRNTDTTIDEYRNYTEAVNEKKERSSENQVIEDTVHEGAEVDKDATNSISKELSESIDNDVNVIKKETALDSESTSQTNSQENIHDVIFNSEAAGTDISTILEGQSMDKAIDGLSTSCDTQKCNIGATTDGQEAKEQISPAANENESSERNIVAHDESIIEKDVDEKTEKKSMEGEATAGMTFNEEKKVMEKQQENKYPAAVEENAADGTVESDLQKENWEDKLEEPSKVILEKNIVAGGSSYTEDFEREDPSEKHEECFGKSREVDIIQNQTTSRMASGDLSSKPESLITEYIHDELTEKNEVTEEIPKSACDEQTQATINTSTGKEVDGSELSQTLEFVSNSVPEDKNQEFIKQEEFSQNDNLPVDCVLKDMTPEIAGTNDSKGNAENEVIQNKDIEEPNNYISVEEKIHGEHGHENGEDSTSSREDRINHTTCTKDKIEVDVSGKKKETEQFNIIPESPENKCQKATDESDDIKIDDSTNDDNSKIVMPGFSDMKEDAENAMKNDEAILNKIEDGCSDGHTVVLKTPEQIDECDDSKAEFGEQMDQAFNDQGNTIYKESANTEELKDVTESPKNHNQGKVTEPKFTDNSAHTGYIDKLIPDTLGHYDHPETAKAKDEDVMEKESGDGSDASALVADIGYGRVSERREDVHQITSSEDNKVVVQQEKEHLDTNSELKPDDQRQGIECEAESTEVEKALDPDKDTNSSAVRVEDSSDATSESNTEETMVGDNCELDHKQEPTNMFDIREKDVPKKEEAADNIVEKSLSTENMNSAEVISENQIEEKNDETTNANSEVLGYEEKQKFKEASDGDDNTKNGIVTEEDKVSGTTAVRQESEPLIETETIEAEISGRVDQVMKVDAYEYQAYEEKDECKESTNLSIEKSIKNENDEKTSNVLDDLSVNATAPDSPAYRNLQADETDQTTKENYRTTEGIPSEEEHKCEDGEENYKGIITISNDNIFDIPALDEESEQVETEHEKADDSSCEEQDGEVSRSNLMVQEVGELKEPDELANEAAAEINDRKKNEGEYGPKKEEAFDACPAESSNTGFNERKAAEVEYLSQQPTEKEEAIDGTTEEVTDAKSISQIDTETMGDTLYAKKISLDKEMQDASVVVPEERIHILPEDNSISAVTNHASEEQKNQTSLPKEEVEDKVQENQNEIQTEQKSHELSDAREAKKNAEFKDEESTQYDSNEEKLEAPGSEKSPHIILENLEATIVAEDIHENETYIQTMEINNEEKFREDEDMKLVESANELELGSLSSKLTQAAKRQIPSEEGPTDDFAKADEHNEGNHCKLVGELPVTHELAQERTDVEGEGAHQQKESVDLETNGNPEQSDTVAAHDKEIVKRSEPLNIKLQKDGELLMQHEESSNTIQEPLNIKSQHGEIPRSSLMVQEVGVQEPDGLTSEVVAEITEQKKNQGEHGLKNEEAFDACPAESSNTGFHEPKAAEVEHLSQKSTEKEEAINGTDEEVIDSKSISQIDTETMGDTLYANKISLDKDMQDTSAVAPEESEFFYVKQVTNSKAVTNHASKEERKNQTSLPKVEVEDKAQENQNKIQTEQKSHELSDASEANENAKFKDEETTQNGSNEEKLKAPESENSSHVIIENLEATTVAEDIHENETNIQTIVNKENFVEDGDMKRVASANELELGSLSNKLTHTAEGQKPSEGGPTENYAKVDEHNEGNHYKVVGELPVMQELAQESTDAEGEVPHQQNESMDLETNGNPQQSDSIAAHDEEIADRSEPLNIKLQKDKEELMQHEVSSNAMLGSQEITNGIASIQKDIIPEEDAVEAAHEQILEEESKDKKNNEVTVDTVSDDEVKEYDSKQIIIVKDSAENLDTSSSIASLAEEAKQEVGEKFSEISDHQPGEYEKEASGVTGTEAEFSKEMTSGVEKPNVVEQLTFSSADSRAACDTYVKGEDFYVAETSRLDDICKEERQEIKEVSDLEPKEVSEQSVMQEPQVNQPEVIMETEQPTEKASLEIEDNLPVSHFLMKYILQEGGEKVGGDYDGQHEDAMDKNNDGDKKNDVQLIKEQSKSEDKVGFEKLQGIPESVQTEESYDVKEKSETTVVKHDKSLQSTVDESTSITTMTEDGKEEIKTISPVKSIYIDEDCSNKLIPVEKSIQGTSVDSEDCREPDSAQDEKIQGTVLKDTITEMEIQKHNETQDKDFDISVQDNVLEKDSLQKEIGEDSRGCLQDREKVKGACVESDGLSIKNEHNNAEAFEITSEVKKIKCGEEKHDVGNQEQFLKNSSEEKLKLSESQYDQEVDRVTESSIHSLKMAETCLKNDNSEASLDKEQLETTNSKVEENNIDEETCETKEEEQKPEKTGLDETGLAYTINDHVLGEITGVQSEGKQVEDFEKVQEATNQNQVQVGNDTTKEMKLAESLEVQQLDLAADSSTQPEQMAEKSLKEGSSAVNADENYPAQTTDTKVDEDKTDAEKDGKEDEQEHNPEDYDHNAEIKVEDRDAELKPAQKKSHGLLSGVGSKVKHSIAKVKKAITGKSSHSKTLSAK